MEDMLPKERTEVHTHTHTHTLGERAPQKPLCVWQAPHGEAIMPLLSSLGCRLHVRTRHTKPQQHRHNHTHTHRHPHPPTPTVSQPVVSAEVALVVFLHSRLAVVETAVL